MKTERAIEVIKEYQKWLDTPPELDNTGIYVDDNLPNRVELDKALSKAVEVMKNRYWKTRCELAEKYIDTSPCDPDLYADQYQAYLEWTSYIEEFDE